MNKKERPVNLQTVVVNVSGVSGLAINTSVDFSSKLNFDPKFVKVCSILYYPYSNEQGNYLIKTSWNMEQAIGAFSQTIQNTSYHPGNIVSIFSPTQSVTFRVDAAVTSYLPAAGNLVLTLEFSD
jgi:hypothetical protein